MHRGVREFVAWMEAHAGRADVALSPPAVARDVQAIEHHVGSPVPADLRLVLGRFNGAKTPGGTLLTAAPGAGATIEAALREVAAQRQASFLDPDALMPFFRTEQGTYLAFERSAAPVSDAWPIVDYDPDSGAVHLMHRTFDGWCRLSVAEWSGEGEGAFDLDRYLRQATRHVEVEPDVSIAHVTLAHALRRAGRVDEALAEYLRGARATPAIPWADWEALKLAALLGAGDAVEEVASRVASRAPAARWAARGTTPAKVALVVARFARTQGGGALRPGLRRALDLLLAARFDEADDAFRAALASALVGGGPLPRLAPGASAFTRLDGEGEDAWWARLQGAYAEGRLRDDDLALDDALDDALRTRDVHGILGIRRDF